MRSLWKQRPGNMSPAGSASEPVFVRRPRAVPTALWEFPAFPNCLGQRPPRLISLSISLFTEPFPDRMPHNGPETRTAAVNIPVTQMNKLRLRNPVMIHPRLLSEKENWGFARGPLALKPIFSHLLFLLLHYYGQMTTQNSLCCHWTDVSSVIY